MHTAVRAAERVVKVFPDPYTIENFGDQGNHRAAFGNDGVVIDSSASRHPEHDAYEDLSNKAHAPPPIR